MWSPTRNIGNVGEDAAVRFLEENGFEILERNYLKKWGEIDIVAEKSDVIHFIEVKSKKHGIAESYESVPLETVSLSVLHETEDYDDFLPEENVTQYKQKRLSRTIRTYLVERRVEDDKAYQADIIAVILDLSAKNIMIRHTEDVVLG